MDQKPLRQPLGFQNPLGLQKPSPVKAGSTAPPGRARRGGQAVQARLQPVPLIVFFVVVAALAVWQTLALNAIWLWLRSGGWFYAALTVIAVAAIWIAYRNIMRKAHRPRLGAVSGVVVLACVVSFAGMAARQSYQAQHGMYLASVTVEADAQLGDYDQRPPFTVAENQTQSHVDINGTLGETTYIPDQQHFGTLVANKGIFNGYGEIIWQAVTDSGQSTAANCQFSTSAARRFDGPFWSNLQRAIIRRAGPELIDQSDAYGVCTAQGAEIIVPLKTYRGAIFTYQVPDGIAVVDKDWNTTIVRDVPAGQYPGPVYPMSLAVKQRDATAALGTWWDHVQDRVGYQPTSDNSEANVSEFNLQRTDGSGDDFVTPLTLVGQSQSINAVGVVASNVNQAGQLNPYQVLTLSPPRQANSAMDSRLRADYGYLQGWAAGMSVYEIVPTGPDTWRATIGQPKAIMYYAEINADGTSCLYSVADQSKIGCSGEQSQGSPTTPGGIDLTGMTDEQLVQLIQQAATQLQQNQQEGR